MSGRPSCDFCGRSEAELSTQAADGSATLEMDADGLWICRDCRGKIILSPVGETAAGELAEKLLPLVGKSAGAICFTLNLPYEPPYQLVIDAASKIAYDEDRFMSTWSFVTQWPDGTTIWRAGGSSSEDSSSVALVAPDGSIHIEPG